MSKDKKMIPDLRFPEFNNAGEWKENVLSNITDAIFDGTHQTPTYTESGIPFFSVENIVSGNKNKFISKEDYEIATNRNKPEKGDILLTRIGKIGFSAIVDWDYEFSIYVTLACIKQSKKFNSYYLHSYFQSSSYQKEILSKSLLNAVPMKINMDELRKTRVLLPPDNEKKEQQKIASCLSSLDKAIEAHSQKLELLKDHKKGLMQNLFPQVGEKVPKYRFPEFKNDSEWSLKQLGVDNLIEIKGRIGYRGYTTEDIVSKGEGAISMSPSNIDENWNLNFEKSTYITWEKYEESPEIMLEDGFTVLVKTGSSYGKAAYIKNLVEKTTINPQLVVLKPKQINSNFLYMLVTNTAVQKQIQETVVGGAIPTLSQDSISKFEVLVPKPKEQQKIAECFSALNDLIILQTQRIEQLKLHKKGLMQSLFPKIID